MAMIASVTATGQNTMSVNIQNTPSGSYIVRVHRKGDASNVWIGSQNVNVPNDAYSANVYFTFYYGNTVSDVDYVSLFDSKYSLLHTKYVSLYYASAPSAPATLTYASSFNSYNRASISWSSVSGATSYVLERALNGSASFSQVYSGSATSYSDTLASTTTKVQYRVKAVNSGGSSGYKTGSVSTVYYSRPNTAPTTPASISVPSTVYGGKAFTVSWGKSTDSDGNLSGYKLEQSYNSGSTWTQVYQGSATSTSITIPFGNATQVMYRVRAYDSSGANSGYKVSGTSTVVNNNAPTVPPSITVPLKVYGGKSVTVTWTASTDSDGNLSGYILERSVDGGSYTQIYKGANKSYSHTVTKGWKTVQYRVCAYDS